jgi:hypothetical protein
MPHKNSTIEYMFLLLSFWQEYCKSPGNHIMADAAAVSHSSPTKENSTFSVVPLCALYCLTKHFNNFIATVMH